MKALLVLTLLGSLVSVVPAGPALSADPAADLAGKWERAHERVAPSERGRMSMAYDEGHDTLVLFGGLNNTGQLGDTWLFEGSWKQAEPESSPSPRLGTAMAYDRVREQVVMFGGHAGTERLAETWAWNGTTWSRLTPLSSPSARSFSTMAYDAARDEIVLFGGMPAGGGNLADTWTWDGSTWTRETLSVSPPYRDSASMVYDPARQEVLLFGGYGQGGALSDTWTWDGSTWEQQSSAASPPRRSSAGLAPDPRNDTVVLFGGIDNVGYRNDTWTWDGATWTQATPPASPPSRASMGLAWHGDKEEVVLFGGSSANLDRNDTWTWDGSRWLSRDQLAPDARHSAVTSSGPDGTAVLFGGMTDAGMSAETWTWDGAWKQEASGGPPARINGAMAYDPRHDEVVLFGGMAADGSELGDTWVWDGKAWTRREATLAPPPRHNHVMAYDVVTRRILLFGGSNSDLGLVFSDTWTWGGGEWRPLRPGTSPPPLSAASMAYDPGHEKIVLFGGYDQNVQRTNATWTWDGFTWSEAQPPASPPARAAGHMSYDPNLGTPVLFGGNAGLGEHLADAWAWDGQAWVELTLPGPAERWGAAFAYSPAAGASVLFGGNRNSYLDDTWVFRSLRRIGADPTLIIDSRTIEGPFWYVHAVSIAEDGVRVAVDIDRTVEQASGIGYGVFVVRADTLQSKGFSLATGHATESEVYVDDDAQAVHEHVEAPGVEGQTSNSETSFHPLDQGDYYIVVVNTAPGSIESTVRLHGDSRVRVVATSQGTAGGFWRETDFEAPRNVQARIGGGAINAHAGVIEDGRIDLHFDHRLFGIYQSVIANPNDVSYIGPDGTERTGQTTYVLSARDPGDYTFKVNEWQAARAGPGPTGYIALLTADVVLPSLSGAPD